MKAVNVSLDSSSIIMNYTPQSVPSVQDTKAAATYTRSDAERLNVNEKHAPSSKGKLPENRHPDREMFHAVPSPSSFPA